MTTEIITIMSEQDLCQIQRAAEILKAGGLVAFPTETVYGLGALAFSEVAVSKIYAAKGRPVDNPLIIHLDSIEKLELYARDISDEAIKVLAAFAPGPITVVLKKQPSVPNIVSGGLDTVAIRIPAHEVARALIRHTGSGIAAPSANISGRPSPTEFTHVKEDLFGKIEAIVDGGNCAVGVESTVVSLVGVPKLLRPGAITLEALREILPTLEVDPAVLEQMRVGDRPTAPGMKYRHYAPKNPLVLVKGERGAVAAYINEQVQKKPEKTGVLCFSGEEKDFACEILTAFGSRADSREQAHKIFDALRELDRTVAEITYGVYPKETGIGLAVCNRLLKAAGHTVIEL